MNLLDLSGPTAASSWLPLGFALGGLAGAVVVELVWGEPPTVLHPVVLMGWLTTLLLRFAPGLEPGSPPVPRRQLFFGLVLALGLPAFFAASVSAIVSRWQAWPALEMMLSAWLLSTTFSFKALRHAADEMRQALRRSDWGQARFLLRNLCSRDSSNLMPEQLTAATIESVSENTSDSFVAPLFYFALFGLPGAVFYRAVNTLDAMVGYRGKYEYLGKPAAKLDDLLNLIPARFTALNLLIAGRCLGHDWKRGAQILWRDHAKTQSPNAGWPMAATAGLLDISLEKPGHYRLGSSAAPLRVEHISQACSLARLCFIFTLFWSAALCVGILLLRAHCG